MARGWESKSVEEQQDAAARRDAGQRPRLTAEEAEQERQREVLRAARSRIVQQLQSAQNPRYRKLLQDELAAVERRLEGKP